jgi:hypothetical protein
MTDTVWAAIVGGIAGVVTGSISAVVAPWANWGIEKRRHSRESRKQIIQSARRIVVEYRRGLQTTFKDTPLGSALARRMVENQTFPRR